MSSAAELAVARVALQLDRLDGAGGGKAASRAHEAALRALDKRSEGPEGSTRSQLRRLFALTGEEMDVLDCAVAVAVEPALGPRIAQLQGLPQVMLPTCVALRLLFGHGAAPLPRSGSPLLTWQLVSLREGRLGEPPAIAADPAIVEWYFGLPSLCGIEGCAVRKAEAPEALSEWEVPANARLIRAAMKRGAPVRVLVRGLEGSGRASLAAAIAKELGLPAFLVQSGDEAPPAASVARIERLALLMGGVVPVWRGDPRAWPPASMLVPLQFLTLEPEAELPRLEGAVDLPMPMPPLQHASVERLVRRLLPPPVAGALSPLATPRLRDLADAAALSVADAESFQTLLRQRSIERVQGVGHIVSSRYGWDDLVLGAPVLDLLRSIEAEARAREALLSAAECRRLFEGTAALTALFAGPPGTGKSMAGQVVAAALKLDLLVVDAGAISSKYIGETAKNLTRAFAVAREASCALMFEEADGLFARRVENDSVNARHANHDTGHLLQLVEAHRHLVMLSTNRRGDIDPAFTRRLRFIVDFTLPEEAQRIELWRRMLRALGVPMEAVDGLAAPLASAYTLSAAQIKSAALSAAFLARRGAGAEPPDAERQAGLAATAITPELLLAGIRRELEKEGRIGEIVTPIGRRLHG